jgi:hypothetical protein
MLPPKPTIIIDEDTVNWLIGEMNGGSIGYAMKDTFKINKDKSVSSNGKQMIASGLVRDVAQLIPNDSPTGLQRFFKGYTTNHW